MGAFRNSGRVVVVLLAATMFGAPACDTAPAPGTFATGGHPGTGGAGTGGAATGGTSGGDAGASDDRPTTTIDACDGDLWDVISEYAMTKLRLGGCLPDDSNKKTIVFDAEGRIVDITGNPSQSGPTKAEWLQLLAERTWPCRAGQTVHYSCFAD